MMEETVTCSTSAVSEWAPSPRVSWAVLTLALRKARINLPALASGMGEAILLGDGQVH